MLEELTAYKTFGTTSHLNIMAHAIVDAPCGIDDLFIIVDSSSTVEIPRIEAAIALLQELGMCQYDGTSVVGREKLAEILESPYPAEVGIGRELFRRMLDEGIFALDKISFDPDEGCAYLHQRDLHVRYSQMRNYLIDVGILHLNGTRLVIHPDGEDVLQNAVVFTNAGLSPEELMDRLEREREIGAAAEDFVMAYERARLGKPLAHAVQQVSLVSVSAGYDIASYESELSLKHDRFIEVKAIGRNGFYLSANELKTAKAYGKQYCLYLVDPQKMKRDGYKPDIIADPAEYFAESSDWRVVPDSYHITKLI